MMRRPATNATATTVVGLVLAGLALTACGADRAETGDPVAVNPAAGSVLGGNPREHLAHRDLATAAAFDPKPTEHLAHRGTRDDLPRR